MLFLFSTPVLISCLWQLKTVAFLHLYLIRAVLLQVVKKVKRCGYCPGPYPASKDLETGTNSLFVHLSVMRKKLSNISSTVDKTKQVQY